ncbi:S-adenosyl-L-methionine-dependent methyltransferase [Lentinula aciculospora]|uniref:S-adenosyl-L-methionine-dependent methyltransferase n=1 Tax=Lentinula aciculospora TaxID=153920 RepID=A0A9W9ABZ9_9AGAR|nr:S-adenosyl-L-methionine-dependent methyltransferase [Lentinula aciculospora]
MSNSHIIALTGLINKAVQDVITEYAAVGQAIPSLDTLESGPFQVPEEIPTRLTKAIKIIEAACAQLCYSVAPPGSVMVHKSLNHEEPACLHVVIEARIANLLLDKPKGLPASELAFRSGLDTMKLTRILRFLATKHCFKEVRPGVFANNRLSMKLLSSDPISSLVCTYVDEGLKASAYLNDTLTDPSDTDGGIPFRRATGYSFFDYHKQPQGLKQGQRFTTGMIGWGDIVGKSLIAKVYPWTSQPADATICDVGGGQGYTIMGLMKAHSHVNLVLQDQPEIIKMAQKFWAEEYPEAIEKQRVQFVPFDFLEETAAQGCDFYYISSVLHNWPDAECEIILKNVRKAMKPSSRVLIHDTVLRDAVHTLNHDHIVSLSDEATIIQPNVRLDVAPEPLLPNYGVGSIRTYELDMALMTIVNAQARTLLEYIELGKRSRLKFEKLYEAGETDLVEFTPF